MDAGTGTGSEGRSLASSAADIERFRPAAQASTSVRKA